MQCTDDSNGTGPCIDSPGEGRLLSELHDGLLFGPAAVRSLRVGEDRRIGATLLGALRSRIPSCTSGCIFFQNRGLISPTAFSGIQVTPPSAMGFGLIRVSGEKYRESRLGECPNSMNGLILIEGPSIGTVDENVSAIDASELYRHAKETIFLLLVVGGERILVEDDGRYVTFMTRLCKLGKLGLNNCNEVGILLLKFGLVHAWHNSVSPIGSLQFILRTHGLMLTRRLIWMRCLCLNEYIREVIGVKSIPIGAFDSSSFELYS